MNIGNLGEIESLYRELLAAWDAQDAKRYAALFAQAGRIVGFDGSEVEGRENIESHLSGIFAHHRTPRYVAKVRGVTFPGAGVAILSGVAGMVPHGRSELNPSLNAVQSLVAVRSGEGWTVALFQNTPAAFHGRPEATDALTGELTAEMSGGG